MWGKKRFVGRSLWHPQHQLQADFNRIWMTSDSHWSLRLFVSIKTLGGGNLPYLGHNNSFQRKQYTRYAFSRLFQKALIFLSQETIENEDFFSFSLFSDLFFISVPGQEWDRIYFREKARNIRLQLQTLQPGLSLNPNLKTEGTQELVLPSSIIRHMSKTM